MKPTVRRNGKHMITVRVEHHLDGQEVAAVLADAMVGETDDAVTFTTRAAVSRVVREHVHRNGDGYLPYLAEHHGDDAWDLFYPQACTIVRRLFPEWRDEIPEGTS